MDDFRHNDDFAADPYNLDKDDSPTAGPYGVGGTIPSPLGPEGSVSLQHQESILEGGAVWAFPRADAWPDSVFSDVPEVGQGYEQVADSIADKQRRDQAYGRVYLPPTAWNDFRMVTNHVGQYWQLKPSAGVFHGLLVSKAGTNWIINFWDGPSGVLTGAAGGGSPIFVYYTAMTTGPFFLDIKFMQGLVVTTQGTAGEAVALWL